MSDESHLYRRTTSPLFKRPAPAPPLKCALGVDPTGTCVFASPTIGDPCITDADCSVALVALRCDLATHSCARVIGDPFCSRPGDCGAGEFCNTTMRPYVCNTTLSLGAPCDMYLDACPRGAQCVADTVDGQFGVCIMSNSVPDGETFVTPAYAFYQAATTASELCASGLGVPLRNSTSGYPLATGRCVGALDLARVGEACGMCQWNDGPFTGLPIDGDGSLVCAPVNRSGVESCVLLPSTIYSASYAATYATVVTPCLVNATGPGGVPCSMTSSSTASCSHLRCFGALAQLTLSVGGLGSSSFDRSWLSYYPELQVHVNPIAN
jgi:hypothetical protein